MKKLSNKSILGQLGCNLIEEIVLGMGQVWRPTSIHDTGVDGEIELRDVRTEQVLNLKLQVQSKATQRSFESESATSFVFRVTKDDIDYWLRGSMPTILIVCRPSSREAYWLSIKDYFADTARRRNGRIEFDKGANRLDNDALPKLWQLAMPKEQGLYSPPLRRKEELVTNLLPISSMPEKLFVAETEFGGARDLVKFLQSEAIQINREWVLRGHQVVTPNDLTEHPWPRIVERGTVEEFSASEWYASANDERLGVWTELLNKCLTAKLRNQWIQLRYDGRNYVHFFAKDRDSHQREYSYRSHKQKASRLVVQRMSVSKNHEDFFYRHSAMQGKFLRFAGIWYLQLNPTYLFTKDGVEPYRFHSEQLAGIKRLELNEAVLGQVVMWEQILQDRGDLFREDYAHLRFGNLLRFEVEQGIYDEHWLPSEVADRTELDADDNEEFLF